MEKIPPPKVGIKPDCYQNIREKINRWARDEKLKNQTGKWTDRFLQYLLILPDLVHLMIKLLAEKGIPTPFKSYIIIGMAYLISPLDIIPDFIPITGFVDDMLVLVVILNKIINTRDKKVLDAIKNHWAGKQDIFVQVKEIVAVLNELSSKIPKTLYDFIKKRS